jgi:hypothetical protein
MESSRQRSAMSERKRNQPMPFNPTLADLLAALELRQTESQPSPREQEKKARERVKIQARREQRATYDLPPAVRQEIKQLAEEHRVPASQIVTLALARFLREYANGGVDLNAFKRPSRSPRYDWNLEIPQTLLPTKKKKNA